MIYYPFKTLCIVIVFAALTLLGAIGSAHSQGLPATLEKINFSISAQGKSAPIKVSRLLLDGISVPIDTPVSVSDNWLSKVVVEVKNASAKDIVSGQLIISFPETGTGIQGEHSPIITSIASVGIAPATAFRRKDGSSRPIPSDMLQRVKIQIPSGGTIRFDFSKDITTLNDAYRIANQIHKVEISPSQFYFADGSKWQSGTFILPVSAPILWKIVSPDKF